MGILPKTFYSCICACNASCKVVIWYPGFVSFSVHKAVKTARKVISKQSQTRRFKLFDEISRVIEDDTLRRDGKEKDGDDRVNLASSEKDKERASWTTEQGNYVSTVTWQQNPCCFSFLL